MQDTQIYSFFLDKGPKKPGIFLFSTKIIKNFRPNLGDSITNPITLETFRVLRDVVSISTETLTRITDQGDTRVTDSDDIRVTQEGDDPADFTHSYFVTPANNPNRISSWTRNTFDDDQTLRQLFR